MRPFHPLFLAASLATALLAGVAITPASADTAVPSVAVPGVVLLPVHLSGQYTANRTAVARIKLPFAAKVLGVSATARVSGGTTPTLTVDVLAAGTSILADPVAVTAGAVAEANVETDRIADEALVTINLAIGGTSPTWDDLDVLITLARI